MDERVEHFIENIQSNTLRQAAEELRMLIFACVPDVQERLKYGIPFYSCKGDICYLTPQKKKLVLGFVQGVKLRPRPGVLVAEDRKQIRHLVFEKQEDIYAELVAEILEEAMRYNEKKQRAKKLL